MARTDILVTGFGPFPRVRVNPTAALAVAVARRLAQAGLEAESLILETSYAGGLPALTAHLASAKPRAVLMLGLAARARWIRVELFARGRASLLHPDAKGGGPRKAHAARPGLPLRTSASPESALAALRRAGLRVRLSASAGRYLCDAGYALALATMKEAPVLFVHVPMRWRAGTGPRSDRRRRNASPQALAAALTEVGRSLARRGRAAGQTTKKSP